MERRRAISLHISSVSETSPPDSASFSEHLMQSLNKFRALNATKELPRRDVVSRLMTRSVSPQISGVATETVENLLRPFPPVQTEFQDFSNSPDEGTRNRYLQHVTSHHSMRPNMTSDCQPKCSDEPQHRIGLRSPTLQSLSSSKSRVHLVNPSPVLRLGSSYLMSVIVVENLNCSTE